MKKRIIVSVILGCIMASLMVTGCKNNSSGQSNKDTGAGAEITTEKRIEDSETSTYKGLDVEDNYEEELGENEAPAE